MTEHEEFIKGLHTGDEVYWSDPDKDDDCSRHIIIQTIEIKGDVVLHKR